MFDTPTHTHTHNFIHPFIHPSLLFCLYGRVYIACYSIGCAMCSMQRTGDDEYSMYNLYKAIAVFIAFSELILIAYSNELFYRIKLYIYYTWIMYWYCVYTIRYADILRFNILYHLRSITNGMKARQTVSFTVHNEIPTTNHYLIVHMYAFIWISICFQQSWASIALITFQFHLYHLYINFNWIAKTSAKYLVDSKPWPEVVRRET